MRYVLLIVVVGTACGNAPSGLRLIDESAWQPALRCARLPEFADQSTVADLGTVTDSIFMAVFSDERRLVLYDQAFRIVKSLQFDKDGPRGVVRPVSAVVTDTAILVADDARSRIRRFDGNGRDLGTVHLSFIPRRLRASGGAVFVAPLVAGASPAQLLFRLHGNRTRALAAPIARYDDIGVNTLANMTALAAFPDRIVLMHELVVPFGYVIDTRLPSALPQRVAVPIPAAERRAARRLPAAPVTERNVNELAVIAFTATADPATGSLYYVTRTGNGRDRPYQKLLVHLDSALTVKQVFPIDVNPHHLVYLAARGSVIAVDAEQRWSECELPRRH